ncbi:RPA-interacting protein-like [Neodiprion virginianus]|uniref:RPA-interacting protein-like n=1 Tax=Neodiprion virginianus TaxID=2961670 RepID=UPI001EE6D09C|nr:RPA-interacting protein-like [Neodiprion virginianus]
MANLLLSPTMSAKLKNRESARKLKNGSPKLQEVLRQRCRDQMRQKRGQLFNKGRIGLDDDEHVHEVLTEIVRRELSSLGTSNWSNSSSPQDLLDPDEALDIEKEMLEEQESWIMEEYERLVQNEEEMLALFAEEGLSEQVICPICQRAALSDVRDAIVCNFCGLTLPSVVSVNDLGRIINENVNSHAETCSELPGFSVVPENNNNSLYLVCQRCGTLSVII